MFFVFNESNLLSMEMLAFNKFSKRLAALESSTKAVPGDDMKKRIEEFELCASEHIDRISNLRADFDEFVHLPEALKNSLRDTMKNGVRTGIPRPEKTNVTKAIYKMRASYFFSYLNSHKRTPARSAGPKKKPSRLLGFL